MEDFDPPGPTPPTSGLARSIRDLFDRDAAAPVPPPQRSGEKIHNRFTTRVARYLVAEPSERPEMEEEIRDDAKELREAQALPALADAVITLTLHALDHPGDDRPHALAAELLDTDVSNHLAVRLGTEREPATREPLGRVAQAHPERMAPALAEELADSPDRGVRRGLMDALRALGHHGRDAVLRLMEDPRWFAVRNGIVLLSEMEDPEVVPALTVPLAHDDPRVRKEAVVALARIGGDDAGLLLLGKLEDSDVTVRAAAAMGVGELRVERAQRTLETMLDDDGEEEVLVQVLRALGRLGDPGAVQGIEKRAVGSMFSKPPRDIRIAAYRALAAIGTPHARKLLENANDDRDEEVRDVVRSLFRENPRLSSPPPPEG